MGYIRTRDALVRYAARYIAKAVADTEGWVATWRGCRLAHVAPPNQTMVAGALDGLIRYEMVTEAFVRRNCRTTRHQERLTADVVATAHTLLDHYRSEVAQRARDKLARAAPLPPPKPMPAAERDALIASYVSKRGQRLTTDDMRAAREALKKNFGPTRTFEFYWPHLDMQAMAHLVTVPGLSSVPIVVWREAIDGFSPTLIGIRGYLWPARHAWPEAILLCGDDDPMTRLLSPKTRDADPCCTGIENAPPVLLVKRRSSPNGALYESEDGCELRITNL